MMKKATFEDRIRSLSRIGTGDTRIAELNKSGALGWMFGDLRCRCDVEEPSIDGFHLGLDGLVDGDMLSVRFAPDGNIARAIHGEQFLSEGDAETLLARTIASYAVATPPL
jgi:hypothetical protein